MRREGTGVSKVKFVLAPMDGMTHAPFRQVCFEYGAEGATTEMISALSYGRVKKKRTAFEETLARLPGEGNLAAQLIGNTPEDMAAAARRLTALNRFDAIDINMGCPARKVVGSGNGAAIMRNPELAAGIMRAVCESTSLPVRLKMRLGWDDHSVTAPVIAQIAQDLGLESITLHGRTRMQMYRGNVNTEAIRAICRSVSIPIYANGGVACAQDALTFLENTGASGVSIGRAALKQPWIFDDIRRLMRGDPVLHRDAPERVTLLIHLARLSCRVRPEGLAVCEMRKFSAWILAGLTNAEKAVSLICRTSTLDDFERVLDDYLEGLVRTGDIGVHPELAPPPSLDTLRIPG